jgi:hypothetical protein
MVCPRSTSNICTAPQQWRPVDFFFPWRNSPQWVRASSLLRHVTFVRTPLDEWSLHRRDLYLTTHNTRKRPSSMPSAEFEPAIPESEWPQTHSLDRAATGILACVFYLQIYLSFEMSSERNASAAFTLLLSSDFRFVNDFTKNTKNVRSLNVPFCGLHNVQHIISPYRTNRFSIDYNCCFVNVDTGKYTIDNARLSPLGYQLFLWPQHVPHREHRLSQLLSKITEKYYYKSTWPFVYSI